MSSWSEEVNVSFKDIDDEVRLSIWSKNGLDGDHDTIYIEKTLKSARMVVKVMEGLDFS